MTTDLLKSMTQQVALDERPARLVQLENSSGMTITLMDIGATWLSCILPMKKDKREVLLGTSSISDYNKMSAYMGVTAGRFANRIAKGHFSIDGLSYQLDTNQAGNTLHGGSLGLSSYRWNIDEQGDDYVQFSVKSKDGDQGFPGELTCSVRYSLTDANEVVIQYKAKTSKTTPVNLTNHAYFNLMGENSAVECTSATLQLNAAQYLPTDSVGIPLGKLEPVTGTSFDFQKAKRIDRDFLTDEQQLNAKGYDHSFYLKPECQQGACAALVVSEDASVALKVFTDKPAIQLYTGNWLSGEPNREGGQYDSYAGLALETQFLPDSPNHPEWEQPSCLLKPDDEYRFKTVYQFEYQT